MVITWNIVVCFSSWLNNQRLFQSKNRKAKMNYINSQLACYPTVNIQLWWWYDCLVIWRGHWRLIIRKGFCKWCRDIHFVRPMQLEWRQCPLLDAATLLLRWKGHCGSYPTVSWEPRSPVHILGAWHPFLLAFALTLVGAVCFPAVLRFKCI